MLILTSKSPRAGLPKFLFDQSDLEGQMKSIPLVILSLTVLLVASWSKATAYPTSTPTSGYLPSPSLEPRFFGFFKKKDSSSKQALKATKEAQKAQKKFVKLHAGQMCHIHAKVCKCQEFVEQVLADGKVTNLLAEYQVQLKNTTFIIQDVFPKKRKLYKMDLEELPTSNPVVFFHECPA
ncbi:hypothetical protein H0H93_013319 [Arthromyces matolae]|nr:hypothetical protein H0H93_013319 [Arthromyces matolae]